MRHERAHHHPEHGHEAHSHGHAAATPGKSSRADAEGPSARPSMLAGARWEAVSASASARHGHAVRPYAKTDRYNRKQHKGRPHVAVGHKQTFTLKVEATRYSIVGAHGAQKFDTLPKGTHVTINISTPRRLDIDGGHHDCVFVRTVKGGSAWMRSDELAGNASKLEHAAHAAADKYAPSAPKGKLKPHVFKTAAQHSDLALTPDHAHQSKSKFEHYLQRHTKDVASGFYNICLNLPQHGTPPVQVDVARPGQHFFVMQTREVAGYDIGGSAKPHATKWAFGCVGKQDAAGHWTPDRSRAGWVPVKTLRKA